MGNADQRLLGEIEHARAQGIQEHVHAGAGEPADDLARQQGSVRTARMHHQQDASRATHACPIVNSLIRSAKTDSVGAPASLPVLSHTKYS